MLALQGCSYSYGRQKNVLNSINADFLPGRSVLLGPNGAGKSTALALCANVISPAEGSVSLNGVDPELKGSRRDFRRAVAWLPQTVTLFPGLRAREHVAYCGWLKGMSRDDAWTSAAKALETVDLTGLANKSTRTLSGGQARRLGIASALVHSAEVILLDEPTAGLDPNQKARFREILLRIPDDIHVVVSTHEIADIDFLFNRVTVMDKGNIVFAGTTSEFLANGEGGTSGAASAYSALIGLED